MIALDVHICDQRRSYVARFSTEQQAIDFITRKSSTHAFSELEGCFIPEWATDLLEVLYPSCEHGLSQSNCCGPQHYYRDEEEQQRY